MMFLNSLYFLLYPIIFGFPIKFFKPSMSLGWLSESTLLPKKRKEIEGVNENSIVGLKTLIDEQSKSKKMKKTKKNKIESKNKGVEERNKRDLKALDDVKKKSVKDDSYNNLLRKAEIYEKIRKGEIQQSEDGLINFQRKQEIEDYQDDEEPKLSFFDRQMVSKDMKNQEIRKNWENQVNQEKVDEHQKETEQDPEKSSNLTYLEKVKQIQNEKKMKIEQKRYKMKDLKE